MTDEHKTLWNATATDKYPPGTTAADLAKLTEHDDTTALHYAAASNHLPAGTTILDLTNMTEQQQSVWDSAKQGHFLEALDWNVLANIIADGLFPQDTTVQDLASIRNLDGVSALHIAAKFGHLPPTATAQDLAKAKDSNNRTALHEAAYNGHLPPGTTLVDLANAKTNRGWSALHITAFNRFLPPDTTVELLKSTFDNSGTSTWDLICEELSTTPFLILQLPPAFFAHDHTLAVITISRAIKRDSRLKAQATLWLGQVLAAQPPTPNRAP